MASKLIRQLTQLSGTPDSADVIAITDLSDSATKKITVDDLISYADSNYIQARQDFAYGSLTGAPTALSSFTNDTNYLDSTSVTGVIDASYIQARQVDIYRDSAFVTTIIDSDYVNARVVSGLDSADILSVAFVQADETFTIDSSGALALAETWLAERRNTHGWHTGNRPRTPQLKLQFQPGTYTLSSQFDIENMSSPVWLMGDSEYAATTTALELNGNNIQIKGSNVRVQGLKIVNSTDTYTSIIAYEGTQLRFNPQYFGNAYATRGDGASNRFVMSADWHSVIEDLGDGDVTWKFSSTTSTSLIASNSSSIIIPTNADLDTKTIQAQSGSFIELSGNVTNPPADPFGPNSFNSMVYVGDSVTSTTGSGKAKMSINNGSRDVSVSYSGDAGSGVIGGLSIGDYDNSFKAREAIAIGRAVTTTGDYAIGIGKTVSSTGTNSIAIGETVTASGDYSTVVGTQSSTLKNYGLSLGFNADTTKHNAITINADSTGYQNNNAFGIDIRTSDSGSIHYSLDSDFVLGAGLTASNFVKVDATSDDVLLGDGTTTSLAGIGGGLDSAAVGGLIDSAVGTNLTGSYSLAIGQNKQRIRLGLQAGGNFEASALQNQYSIAIGQQSNVSGTGDQTIYMGFFAGWASGSNDYTIGIGSQAGRINQGKGSVAIGFKAGYDTQGGGGSVTANAVAVGYLAGEVNQSRDAVAIGNEAAGSSQGSYATAIGSGTARFGQGNYSIALGYRAGYEAGVAQAANNIIVNATGSNLNRTDQYGIDIRTSDSGSIAYSTDSDWVFGAGVTMTDLTSSGATIVFSNLPSSDPVNAGQLWNDGGTLKVSAG